MVKKGDLIEFKPGLFTIEIPNNFGIFIKTFRKKNSKERYVELYTLKGKQETKQTNIIKKNLGESIQLVKSGLPASQELNKLLKTLINRVNTRETKLVSKEKAMGELNERGLWKKLVNAKLFNETKSYSVEELAFVWYGVAIEDLSRNRIKKIRSVLESCRTYGQGFFDADKANTWKPISIEMQKSVAKEINLLGSLRNKMFHVIEVQVEDSDDPEETEFVRAPKPWEDIKFTTDEQTAFDKLCGMMAFFVENDHWSPVGMGDTHIFALDGFSLRSFLSNLAEDWVNEGRTSIADVFVKLLIRINYWNDSQALLIISQRVIKLAPHFAWVTDERIEGIAAKYKEPKDTDGVFEGRTDLQHLVSYTIDPPTAKDFDDAISLETTNSGYILWVHIADVAHYVEKDSSLDLHARARATSVYLPTKTIPMLPTHLSDNLCSLREQLPRLAMSVEIHYDNNGIKQFDKCKVHNSVILVDRNLSYNDVNVAIENKEEPFYGFNQFAELIRKERKGLNLETDDVRLELEGKMAVAIKTSSPSTKMIEAFMVAANETVAEILEKNGHHVIFRGHPLPDSENIKRFNAHAKVLNFDISIEIQDDEEDKIEEDETSSSSLMDLLSKGGGGNISFTIGGNDDFASKLKAQLEEQEGEEVDLTPTIKGLAQLDDNEREKWLQPFRAAIEYVEKIEDEDYKKIGYLTVLRTLSRALYSSSNFGHFGLGSTAYLHFTSPIRRYPDVIAHRVCKAFIAGEELEYDKEEMENIAIHCNEQSEIAEKLERTIVGSGFSFLTRNPKYTQNRQGIITSITGGAIYVLLPNGIEARVRLSKITTRPTFVDEYGSMCFIGFQSTDQIAEEITVDNWRELLKDEDSDEPIQIIAKLGDKLAIDFTSWNHIEGIVEGVPQSAIEDGEFD